MRRCSWKGASCPLAGYQASTCLPLRVNSRGCSSRKASTRSRSSARSTQTTRAFLLPNGKLKSAVTDWQRSLAKVYGTAAAVPDAHAHPYRDSFVVELLLSGMPLERVSVLLGHSSVKITERHYAPWVL